MLACTGLAACWDRRSGDAFGQLVLVAIIGGIIAFLAAILTPILLFVLRVLRRSRDHGAALASWYRSAQVTCVELTPSLPAQMAFTAVPGIPYAIWLSLGSVRAPRTFRLSVCVRVDGEPLLDQTYDVREDFEDGFIGFPPYVGMKGFTTPDNAYIDRAVGFVTHRAGHGTVVLTIAPLTNATSWHPVAALLMAGDAPSGDR